MWGGSVQENFQECPAKDGWVCTCKCLGTQIGTQTNSQTQLALQARSGNWSGRLASRVWRWCWVCVAVCMRLVGHSVHPLTMMHASSNSSSCHGGRLIERLGLDQAGAVAIAVAGRHISRQWRGGRVGGAIGEKFGETIEELERLQLRLL